ncbi:MAG: aminoglycoside phosphotransferase family protein [Anaerolineae bacterium]|nr:aminoglycoside phosphotransferase family protein [Anaerolineae bacterium]
MDHSIDNVIAHYSFAGTVMDVHPFGAGHINDTYRLVIADAAGEKRYLILQRINRNVFHQPVQVMENIEKITRHVHGKVLAAGGDPEREVLNLVPTTTGTSFCLAADGEVWRMVKFITGARTYETVENPRHVYEVGKALGRFQAQLADFDAGQLYETIPGFHHTPGRLLAFKDIVQRDPANRVRRVKTEIDFILERQPQTAVVVDLLREGKLPWRVTHNDTKFNNVMIDDATGQGICLIDLDTVMPGSALYDFGDAVRTTTALSLEDEPDTDRAGFSLPYFETLAHGYLDAARGFLTAAEIDLLAFAGVLITLEQGIRFLGDYLAGDTYYKIHRPEHNLDRARTQIRMVQEMEGHMQQMEAIVTKYREEADECENAD